MSEVQSLLTAGAILAVTGLGLFLYKSEENEKDDIEDKEHTNFVDENKTDEENREIYDDNKPKKVKTRKSRRRGGGGTKRSTF
jgi:hypothetical protein